MLIIRERGFTMVELIMVIVIIGILAVVVGPRFFDRQVFDERVFYEDTISAVRYAQKLALASGCLTQVTLSSAAGYRVLRAAGCSSGAYTVDVLGPDGQSPFRNANVPSGVTIATTGFPLVFDSLGRPLTAATASFGSSQGFRVLAETGLVQ